MVGSTGGGADPAADPAGGACERVRREAEAKYGALSRRTHLISCLVRQSWKINISIANITDDLVIVHKFIAYV